jgi:DNA-binding transcriptional MerR regulator
MGIDFPDKLYYKIGEAGQIAGVRTSVLRFWETEFEFLRPVKSPTGQRLYTKQDVELILEIKRLLYTEKFTLEGVRKQISPRGKLLAESPLPECTVTEHLGLLREIRGELQELRCHL